MQAPAFWTQDSIQSRLLSPLSYVYGRAVALRRNITVTQQIGRPVICVGNFVMGGAGKTPVALSIGSWYREKGYAPHFLTRGYGGRLPGPVQVDSAIHSAAEVGDEALLLARCAPTWVSRDRPAGASAAVAAGADVIVMDDGFQNGSLHKDLSIVVIDGGYGLGNGRVFPAGPLREALGDGLSRANAIAMLGPREDMDSINLPLEIPVMGASLIPQRAPTLSQAERVVAFAGIGRPQKFFDTLADMKVKIAATKSFPDHHSYSSNEIDALKSLARRENAVLVTTEKDFVRLDGQLAEGIDTIPVIVEWKEMDALDSLLSQVVSNG